MKNGQKSSLYGETSLYSEEIPYSELFSKIHYMEYPLYWRWITLKRKSIRPFGDFSYKTLIFRPLEKCLKLSKKSFSKFVATFTNEGHVSMTFGAKIFTPSKDTTL